MDFLKERQRETARIKHTEAGGHENRPAAYNFFA
jgi:hypothetical protein